MYVEVYEKPSVINSTPCMVSLVASTVIFNAPFPMRIVLVCLDNPNSYAISVTPPVSTVVSSPHRSGLLIDLIPPAFRADSVMYKTLGVRVPMAGTGVLDYDPWAASIDTIHWVRVMMTSL